MSRRAFSLIEAVAVVVVLGIAVPSTLRVMDSGVDARIDAVQADRATLLVTSVLEQVVADSHSDAPGLGFDAFDDANAYLNTPGSGLWDRMGSVVDTWASYGLTAGVTIGALSDASGVVTGDPDEDVYRRVTVAGVFDDASGEEVRLEIGVILTGGGS